MDNTYQEGSLLIDFIAILINAMECVEVCTILETHGIVISDYRSYIIDFKIEEYFGEELSS